MNTIKKPSFYHQIFKLVLPIVIHHYRKGKWLKNITRDDLF